MTEEIIDDKYRGRQFSVTLIEHYQDDQWKILDRYTFDELSKKYELKSLHPEYSKYHTDTYVTYDNFGHCLMFRVNRIILSEKHMSEMRYLGNGAYGGKK